MLKFKFLKKRINLALVTLCMLFFVFVLPLACWSIFSSPNNYLQDQVIRIEKGFSLFQVAQLLEENEIIKSAKTFVVLAKVTGNETEIKSGDYSFSDPSSVYDAMERLCAADFGIAPVKVLVLEGYTLDDISNLFDNFENFDKQKFLKRTIGMEGYFFPDTYFFLPNADEEEVINTMRKNFDEKVGEVDHGILTMASIIEKEIANYGERRIVSGVLWKRIDVGMPLQVDAVFPYIIGKKSSELTLEDLKVDSPYNTYLYKGLPPAPICNPSLDSIEAAKNPEDSPYWFYLSDKTGKTHFSKTFEEHKIYKAKYLK